MSFPIGIGFWKQEGGGGWTPAQITTACWIDASDNSTITYSSGNTVDQIDDKSGNGNHFVDENASARPLITTFMGNQVVQTLIPPNQDRPASIPLPFSGTGSYFRVVYFNDPFTIEHQDGTSASRFGLISRSGSSSTNISFNYGSPSFYQDGVLQSWANQGDVFSSVDQNFTILQDEDLDLSSWSSRVQWGAYPSGSVDTVQYLGEMIWISGSVSTATRELIEGYLAHKWGLTASLPIGHPYKTSAP